MRTMTSEPELIEDLLRRMAAAEDTIRCLQQRLTIAEDATREMVYLVTTETTERTK